MTLDEITAQAFIFFGAGFETSSTTMSYCLYEIAKNLNIQRKVQEEIDRVKKENNGELSYESVKNMTFLENCIDGKYPIKMIFCR